MTEYTKTLAGREFTIAEDCILQLVRYEERPVAKLIGYALALEDAARKRIVTGEDLARALETLLHEGYLQVIDESVLRSIESELEHSQVLGPISGFPNPGTVDFTKKGASLFGWSMGVVYSHDDPEPGYTRMFSDSEILLRCAQDELEPGTVGQVVQIGPWRARWWQEFPSGFCVTGRYKQSQ
jgi:hypothetical protein